MQWTIPAGFGLWQAAIAVVPLAMLCGAICRLLPLRAPTRHCLWVATLSALILPLILPSAPRFSLPTGDAATDSHQPLEETSPGDHSTRSTIARSICETSELDAVNSQPATAEHTQPPKLQTNETVAPSNRSGETTALDTAAPSSARVERSADARGRTASRPRRTDFQPSRATGDNLSPHSLTSPVANADEHLTTNLPLQAPAATTEAPPTAEATAPEPISAPATGDGHMAHKVIAPSLTRDAWLLAWRATAATWFLSWIEAFRWARDGLARLPVVPTEIWLSGIALLALIQFSRVARFRRRLRRAIAAPDTIARSVEDVTRALGLRRAPRTLMLDERISPLIWCGRRPTLILPLGLWSQLDKHGRKAILTHELAHLQRLDHWVCWLEQAVTLVYWWHPLVWWIRKRIHEEADLSCDAWVTWLMPQGRRAYAEALLRTKQFVSVSKADLPAGGMAAASGKAREFARRLTMVMTHSARPRPSVLGLLLSAGIATAGWLGAPAWSCPPEEAELSKAAAERGAIEATVAGDGQVQISEQLSKAKVVAPRSGPIKTDRLGVRFHAPTLSTNPFVQGQSRHAVAPLLALAAGGGDDDDRLARLEAELKRLSEQLERLNHDRHGVQGQTAPVPGQPAMPPTPPTPPSPPSATTPAPGAPRARMRAPQPGGPEVIRGYELPPEKLEALWQLMSRDDVPPRVSMNGNQIQLHADEHHQEMFRQFIEMIHPDGQQRRAPEARGQGASRGGRGAGAAGGRRSMRAPDEKAWRELVAGWQNDGQPQAAAREMLANAELWRAAAAAGSDAAREKALVAADRLRALAQLRQGELANYEQLAETMGVQAEQFVDQARAMMEQALTQDASQNGAAMQERARALEQAARELEAKARQFEAEARQWEEKARAAEREADEADEQMDELNSMLESFDEMDDAEAPDIDVDVDEDGESHECPTHKPAECTTPVPAECITPKPAGECTPAQPASSGGKVL